MESSSVSLMTGEEMFNGKETRNGKCLARLRGQAIVEAPFLTHLMPFLIDLALVFFALDREVVEATEWCDEGKGFAEDFMTAQDVSGQKKKGKKKEKKREIFLSPLNDAARS